MKFSLYLLVCTVSILAAAAMPDFEMLKRQIRPVHPRLFLAPETRQGFAARAARDAAPYLKEILAVADRIDEHPALEPNLEYVAIKDGKLVFICNRGDQNQLVAGLRSCGGGIAAMQCAVAYLATGKEVYLHKAVAQLRYAIAVNALADRSRIMVEWWHFNRLCALVAYDWLYPDLTPEERRAVIVPLLEHIEHMQNPGYRHDNSSFSSGNYGEPGLMWYAGLAAFGDGFCDELAESLLKRGYEQQCLMMDFREEVSGGTGVLASIADGYAFGRYPFAGFNFLHTLRSGFDLDGTKQWRQMRDYPHFLSWLAIPRGGPGDIFLNFGWGDTCHYRNNIDGMPFLYSHMAQCLHFYGENPTARAIMAFLPEEFRRFESLDSLPFLPFVLDRFQSVKTPLEAPEKWLANGIAAEFPSYGLTVMRSGFGPDDTYAAFKGGARYTTHQHYDENTFVLYKRGFQALDTGCRGNTPHHLIYYPQTIAHNGILIRMDGEALAPHWYPDNAPKLDRAALFADGGQNRKTGTRPIKTTVSLWHVVCGGDATACYDRRKSREVVRQFVYLKPDYFVIYDRVTSVTADQQKVFLLHTEGEPTLVDGVWRSSGGDGTLMLKTLLPTDAKTEKIGGPGQEFFVRGVSWPANDYAQMRLGIPGFWLGRYRLEISPSTATPQTRFLTLIQLSGNHSATMVPAELLTDKDSDGVRFTTADGKICTIHFQRTGLVAGTIRLEQNGKVLLDGPLHPPVEVGPPQKFNGDLRGTARVDALIPGGDLVWSEPGTALSLERPAWLNGGKSVVVHFSESPCRIMLMPKTDGMLELRLKGPDIREHGKRIPFRVEFRRFSVNGQALLQTPVNVWHNQEQRLHLPVKAGIPLTISAEFRLLK